MAPLTEHEIVNLPVRELGLRLLERMDPQSSIDIGNFLSRIIAELPVKPGAIQPVLGRSWLSEPQLTRPLAEAWDWLYVNGLTAREPTQTTFLFVTRLGQAVIADPSHLPGA